jgi:hypothetical protein
MIKFFRNIRRKLIAQGKTANYLKYAIGEIVLVVIGILIALQVNNWNETRLEQKRIRQYAKSLVQDLKSDIEMLKVSQFQAEKKFIYIDSLKHYVNHTPHSELSNTVLWVITHDIIYRPLEWNRSTLNELKNSGGLRYITNDSLQKKLVAYESFSNHLDEDFQFDKSNAQKGDDMMALLLKLNSPYLSKLQARENGRYNKPDFNIYNTEEYRTSKANDLKLISYDEALIEKFVNTFILIQENYSTRAFKELPKAIEDAQELITLLQMEYRL